MTLLAGPVGEKAGPPAWPPCSDDGMAGYSDEKALARIVRLLNLNEKQWNELVDVTRIITRHPGIKRVEKRIGAMLEVRVTLDGRMLKDIHEGTWREFAEETRPRTKAERDDDEVREQHRRWMTGVLEAGTQYAIEQAAEQAVRDLRRRCDELAAEVAQNGRRG